MKSELVHDLSATITASKSGITRERSLRFKCRPTFALAFEDIAA